MLAWLRERVSFAWGHIDDLILVDPDPLLLKKVLAAFKKKCFRAGWFFNTEKSTNIPTTTIKFLGSIWTRHGVRRLHEVSKKLFKMVSYLCWLDPPPKDMERVRSLTITLVLQANGMRTLTGGSLCHRQNVAVC